MFAVSTFRICLMFVLRPGSHSVDTASRYQSLVVFYNIVQYVLQLKCAVLIFRFTVLEIALDIGSVTVTSCCQKILTAVKTICIFLAKVLD